MKIKTVWNNVDHSAAFDAEVNELLTDGWQLVKREVLPGMSYTPTDYAKRLLYAELVKLDEADMKHQEPDPVNWQEAVEVLRETCRTAEDCGKDGCPMFDWCQKSIPGNNCPPCGWGDPEGWSSPSKQTSNKGEITQRKSDIFQCNYYTGTV